MTDYAKLDAWIDAHFDEEVRFLQELVRVPTDTPPGNNAPHAERTAELLKDFGFDAEKHPVPEGGEGLRPAVDHQPDRAPPLRRRPHHRAQRARRRGAARRRLERTIRTAARSPTARSTAALRGEQERLRELHLRRARAGVARRR
jgi:acetylornithine deacetylase/succinyl-diaminopimelate desuccinylase-like protein